MDSYEQNYINGQWVDSIGGTPHQVINPATEEPGTKIVLGTKADVDAAVAAAKTAFKTFSQTSREERLALLERIIEEYQKRMPDIAASLAVEMGAPVSLGNAAQAPAGLGGFMGTLEALKTFEFTEKVGANMIAYEPIGVVGMITPWNWPLNQITLKVAPALAGGNTMVLKPSEECPGSAAILAEVMDAAGVPPGVFNLVQGDGPIVGAAISSHPDVDMVSFTGSTRAGRLISIAAADTLKRVHLELGGKGANLVFADADDKAVKRGVLHMMNNTGQSCNAPSRMVVEASRYDAAVEEAAAVASKVTVGPASEEGRHIGPVVNGSQWEKIQALIEKGIAEGARLVAGGPGRPEGFNKGFYVRPTVFADVTNDMTIAQEEIFGPVLSILKFESEEEAVQIANDTPYGLTNYVQSSDPERRQRLARQLRSGMVEMNGESRGAGAPFGGMKMSGNGREGGSWGIHDFVEVKAVSGWAAE